MKLVAQWLISSREGVIISSELPGVPRAWHPSHRMVCNMKGQRRDLQRESLTAKASLPGSSLASQGAGLKAEHQLFLRCTVECLKKSKKIPKFTPAGLTLSGNSCLNHTWILD